LPSFKLSWWSRCCCWASASAGRTDLASIGKRGKCKAACPLPPLPSLIPLKSKTTTKVGGESPSYREQGHEGDSPHLVVSQRQRFRPRHGPRPRFSAVARDAARDAGHSAPVHHLGPRP